MTIVRGSGQVKMRVGLSLETGSVVAAMSNGRVKSLPFLLQLVSKNAAPTPGDVFETLAAVGLFSVGISEGQYVAAWVGVSFGEEQGMAKNWRLQQQV